VLTAGGKTYRQPIVVKLDPRVQTSAADLQAQLDLARLMTDAMGISYRSYYDVASLRAALADRQKTASVKEVTDMITALMKEIDEISDGNSPVEGFGPVNRDVARYLIMIEGGDLRPADSARANYETSCTALKTGLARWRVLNSDKLSALNKLLQQNNLAAVPTVQPPADPVCKY
jgi:hypothetical protein